MAKAAPFPLPARLEIMRAFYTLEIVEAATRRVILGESIPASFSKGERKAALLLVRELNPDEIIEQGEECILRGKKQETLKEYKDAGDFPRFINGSATRQR